MAGMQPVRILVALSGGVDSGVAAALLAREGHEVVGVFMRNGMRGEAARRSCCSLSDARDARAVADGLRAPFYVHDLQDSFARLIDDFARDYAAGLTPNPCIACNNRLKFGELVALADDLGCAAVATGHYARLAGGRLRRAADAAKDQSYLLHGLTPAQLARARFPVGELSKPQVRALARELRLPVADKPDSADICFVPGGDYRAVVRERLGHLGAEGEIVDGAGRALARHGGVGAFTVGQRRGVGVSLGEPAYVTAIDPQAGRVQLGPREELARRGCRVLEPNWQSEARPARALVQLRHHHAPEAASLALLPDGSVRVDFERPSFAVTPGQSAVFYEGDTVLGGGRIARDAAGPQPATAGP
jgi:tRNA-uridine 2-sulfurtransferase